MRTHPTFRHWKIVLTALLLAIGAYIILIAKPQQWQQIDDVTGIVEIRYRPGTMGHRTALVRLDDQTLITVNVSALGQARKGERVFLSTWIHRDDPERFKYKLLKRE